LIRNGTNGKERSFKNLLDPQHYLEKNLKIILMKELEQTQSQKLQTQSAKPNELIGNWVTTAEDNKIALTLSEKRIGQFDRVDMADIVDLMAQWRLMLGVTSDTTQEELIFITQFIYDNYKHLTLSDLNIAKNWSILGRIDVGFVTQKTFSSYYVSRCINAYEEEKRKIINQIAQNKERYETRKAIDNPTPQSAEEKANSFKDHILTMYRASNEDRPIIDLADMVYNWLKAVGFMKLSDLEIKEAMLYATDRLREMNFQDNKLNAKNQFDPQTEDMRKKKFAREYVINKVFKKLSVSDIVSKISIEYFKK
jgi:hypothetical protein